MARIIERTYIRKVLDWQFDNGSKISINMESESGKVLLRLCVTQGNSIVLEELVPFKNGIDILTQLTERLNFDLAASGELRTQWARGFADDTGKGFRGTFKREVDRGKIDLEYPTEAYIDGKLGLFHKIYLNTSGMHSLKCGWCRSNNTFYPEVLRFDTGPILTPENHSETSEYVFCSTCYQTGFIRAYVSRNLHGMGYEFEFIKTDGNGFIVEEQSDGQIVLDCVYCGKPVTDPDADLIKKVGLPYHKACERQEADDLHHFEGVRAKEADMLNLDSLKDARRQTTEGESND